MLKKKTERLIPQSDQPKKQVSRGKVTVPKNSKQNAISTEQNSKKPNFRQEKFRRSEKTKSAKNKKSKFKNTAKIRSEKRYFKACEKRTQDNQSNRQLKGTE